MEKKGQLVDVSHHIIRGWAELGEDGNPPRLEIYLDGRLFQRLTADKPSANGDAVRSFEQSLHLTLGPNPIEVSVRRSDSKEELEGSPATVQPVIDQPSSYYTKSTSEWLDQRFGDGAWRDGVYLAHQPVYGFRTAPSEPNWQARYRITYQLLQGLNQLDFDSLVDIGGAEGYTAGLVHRTFGGHVVSCDLSTQACRRATQLFGLESKQVDMHALPFDDGAFDVVVASETIEHVADCMTAVDELLRVARRAVVVTVPHDALSQVEEIIAAGVMHGHIHHFDLDSFDYLKERGYDLEVEPILSGAPMILWPGYLMECDPAIIPHIRSKFLRQLGKNYPKVALSIFNKPVASRILGLDSWALKRWPNHGHHGVRALILKDPTCRRSKPRCSITMEDVFNFSVPHLLQKQESA